MFLGSGVATANNSLEAMLLSFEEGREDLSQAITALSNNKKEIDELKAELFKAEQENNKLKLQIKELQNKELQLENERLKQVRSKVVTITSFSHKSNFCPFGSHV